MVAGHLIGLVLAVLAAFGFAYLAGRLIRRDTEDSSRVLGMPSSAPEKVFLGASRSQGVRAHLEFHDWGLRLSRGTQPIGRDVPVWEARYEELGSAQLVSSIYSDPGVRFVMRVIEDSVIFWSPHSAEILDHLGAQGLSVDRNPRRLWHEPDTYHSWPEPEAPQPAWWDWRTMPPPWPMSGRENGAPGRGWRRTASSAVFLVAWAAIWVGIMWLTLR